MRQTRGRTGRACLLLGILAFAVACVFAAHHELLVPAHPAHAASADAASPNHDPAHGGTATAAPSSCDSSDGGGCLTAPTDLPLSVPAPAPDILLPPPPAPVGSTSPPADRNGRSPPDLAELSILRI